MNIDALIEKIQPKFIINFYEISMKLGQISCIRASIFILGEAQQGIEGRAYKLV